MSPITQSPFPSVTVQIEQLRRNLTKSDGRKWTTDEVIEWLQECGFTISYGLLVADESSSIKVNL
jgi:hypothetical protein